MRLAERKKGVNLTEISETRCLGKPMTVKGPFQKTMKSAFNKKMIEKGGWKRGGEDVYVLAQNIEEFEPEDEDRVLNKNFMMDSISNANSANELGDIFIAVGKFLKNLKA